MTEIRMRIAGGRLSMVYTDAAVGLLAKGRAATTRASHVEPASTFGVSGGGWLADMSPVGGTLLGAGDEARDGLRGFETRDAALAAERLWLLQRFGI